MRALVLGLLAVLFLVRSAALGEAPAPHWADGYMAGEDELCADAARGAPGVVRARLGALARGTEVRVRALALSLECEQAARLGLGKAEVDEIRAALIAIAASSEAPGYARDRACRGLLTTNWPGRDACLGRLMTLNWRDLYDGTCAYFPLGWIFCGPSANKPLIKSMGILQWAEVLRVDRAEAERRVPWLVDRLRRAGAVRDNAARLLTYLCEPARNSPVGVYRPAAVALLPWLLDEAWANAGGGETGPRGNYIASLARISMPEAIPGLIHIVETKHGATAAYAAGALARNPRADAIPVLRKALPEHASAWERNNFFGALLACGGYSIDEQVAALEAFARTASSPGGAALLRVSQVTSGGVDLQTALGNFLAHQECKDRALISALARRVAAVRAATPEVARALEAPLFIWNAPDAARYAVARLETGVDEGQLAQLLRARVTLVGICRGQLERMQAGGREVGGRAAALLADGGSMRSMLLGHDDAAVAALLEAVLIADDSGSRDFYGLYSRTSSPAPRLSLEEVGPLLDRPDPRVAAAARRWVVNEGGPAARAWLEGKRGAVAADPVRHRYAVDGISLGMTRDEAAARATASRKDVEMPYRGPNGPIKLPVQAQVQYSKAGRVVAVRGSALRDGERAAVGQGMVAADVRALFGRPMSITAGHVFFTIGGFFWHYVLDDKTIAIFSFTDDDFTKGEKAPLYQVALIDRKTYDERVSP